MCACAVPRLVHVVEILRVAQKARPDVKCMLNMVERFVMSRNMSLMSGQGPNSAGRVDIACRLGGQERPGSFGQICHEWQVQKRWAKRHQAEQRHSMPFVIGNNCRFGIEETRHDWAADLVEDATTALRDSHLVMPLFAPMRMVWHHEVPVFAHGLSGPCTLKRAFEPCSGHFQFDRPFARFKTSS